MSEKIRVQYAAEKRRGKRTSHKNHDLLRPAAPVEYAYPALLER